jgi:hypothetical protein
LAGVQAGVNPADIKVWFIEPLLTNTGNVTLSAEHTGQIVAHLAWALAAGLAINFAALLMLFGSGP